MGQKLWCLSAGLVALQHVDLLLTGDQTCVPCVGRQILFFFFLKMGRQISTTGPVGLDVQELLILLQLESGEAHRDSEQV